MNYASIFKGRWLALFRDITSLFIILLAVIVSVWIEKGSMPDETAMFVAVVNEDTGELGEHLADVLLSENGFDLRLTDRDEAVKMIASNKAHGMIVIRPDFTEKVRAGAYEKLVETTIMADSYDMNTLGELVINDTVKIWMEELIGRKLGAVSGIDEADLQAFRENAVEVLHGGSLLDVNANLVADRSDTDEEQTFSGLRWYAAFALFYLMISGTWMCAYGSGGLLKRVRSKGGNVVKLFVFQSLPGMLITYMGLLPVLLVSGHPKPVQVLAAFLLYIAASSAMSLLVCALAGSFSNLVFLAPVVTMAASLVSGMLCKLPDWARVWDYVSVIFPGHWFYAAILQEDHVAGALVATVFWFLAGMSGSLLLGNRKK
ncbi:MAG: ABC transporter permease [Lachnospiraceae bacterium]|nr:ABC transporter permease [Lachnospiraceae bacterium]